MNYSSENMILTESVDKLLAFKIIDYFKQNNIAYKAYWTNEEKKLVVFEISKEYENKYLNIVTQYKNELYKTSESNALNEKIADVKRRQDKQVSCEKKLVQKENYDNKNIVLKCPTTENRKRDRRITLRMEEKDYLELLKKMDTAGIKNLTDFLNELIKNGQVKSLDIPTPTEEMLEELHDIKHEIRAIRIANGKAVGLIKKAIKLNEDNEMMDKEDFLYLRKYLNELSRYNKDFDFKIHKFESEMLKLWQL